MSDIERLLHNLVSATANVACARGMLATQAERQRDEAVRELAVWLTEHVARPAKRA